MASKEYAKLRALVKIQNLGKLKQEIKARRGTDQIVYKECALSWAAADGAQCVLSWLIASGMSVEKGDKESTPLFTAASNGRTDSVKLLLDNGASVDRSCFSGTTPLMGAAASDGHADVIALLLQRGADPNAQDDDGNSALMMSAEAYRKGFPFLECARLLLAAGSNSGLKNHAGKTARDYAIESGAGDVVAVIDEHEAQQSMTLLKSSVPQGKSSPSVGRRL